MRSSCLRLATRAVSGSRFRTFGSTAPSEPAERRRHTAISELFLCQPAAWRFGTQGSLHDTLGDNTAIRNNSNRLPHSDTKAPHICGVRLLPGSTFRASPSIPDGQLYGSGFRPCSSIAASRKEEIVDGFQETASDKRNEVIDAPVVRGGDSGVDLEVDCIEVRGDGPNLSVSEAEVPKLQIRNVSEKSRGSAEVSEPISFRADNLELLQTLRANEEHWKLILKWHPELGEKPAPHFLESVRLFHKFGMDAHVLVLVLSKLNKRRRSNIFLNIRPNKPKQILTFLQEEIGVRNMEKVVTNHPNLLMSLVETLSERVKTLKSLGLVVDGALVEIYYTFLSHSENSMRESAEALEMAGGPRCYLKHCRVLQVKGQSIRKRVTQLQAILGEPMARKILGKRPDLLLSGEATLNELWSKLTEFFRDKELMTRIQRCPQILGVNWKTFNAKLEYLTSTGFTKDEMLTNFSIITTSSLERFIKPRVEVALRSYREHGSCLTYRKFYVRGRPLLRKVFLFRNKPSEVSLALRFAKFLYHVVVDEMMGSRLSTRWCYVNHVEKTTTCGCI